MFSLDYHRCIHPPRSNAELRMNTVLKPTRNWSQWHFALCRLALRGMNIQIIPVIPIVQIVTNQDTGSADVGQKVVELKGKDHAKRRDSRKGTMQRIRIRRSRRRTMQMKQLKTTIQIMNHAHRIQHIWPPHHILLSPATNGSSTAQQQLTSAKLGQRLPTSK